jgi:hypothetical protein
VRSARSPKQVTDERNSYKVEKWTSDGRYIDRMIYAGNNLDIAPASALTIRQRGRVLDQFPAITTLRHYYPLFGGA